MIGPKPPVHPGEILREEFMIPLELSGYALAAAAMCLARARSVWRGKRRL
jgi:plasmid maintenance system antidote protein VapI